MVRSNRIKDFKFESDSLTADASGDFDSYSENPINGKIQTVYWEGSNMTATGSLTVSISGAGANILSLTSGTGPTTIDSEFAVFPRAATVALNMVPISGADGYDEFAEICVNSVIRVVGAGCGNGTSGLGLTLVYI